MNIFLLVSSFLIILSYGTYTLMRQNSSALSKQSYYTSALALEQKAHNTAQRRAFTLEKNKLDRNKAKNQPTQEKKEKPEGRFSRDVRDPRESSKLNLGPLFAAQPPIYGARFYEIATDLLRHLYQGTAVEKLALKSNVAGFEFRILDALIARAKQEGDLDSFDQLIPDERELKEVYLKMVKGTKSYNLLTKEGYPPLGDFFRIAREEKDKPLSFCAASTPLLKVVFGEKLTQAILDEERLTGEKRSARPLKKDELESLLLKNNDPKFQMGAIQEYMHFKRAYLGPKTLTVRNPKNKFSYKVPLKTSTEKTKKDQK